MRFWKGPVNPWTNIITQFGLSHSYKCSPDEREANLIIEVTVKDDILNLMKADQLVLDFVNQLRRVDLEFNRDDFKVLLQPLIMYINDLIASGTRCSGFGGDNTIKNAYYYITTLLGLPAGNNDAAFHQILNMHIPTIINIERNVTERLLKITDPRISPEYATKYNALLNRQNLLIKSYIPEPPFPIRKMAENVHTD
jgi:hypothetical protein